MNEDVQPVRTVKKGLRRVLAIAAVIAAVLALGTAALMKPVRWSFRVEPVPATATVSLVDGSEPYQPGMLLVPGMYEVEVSAPGYVTRREWITHSESPTSHRIVLEGRQLIVQPTVEENEAMIEDTGFDSQIMLRSRIKRAERRGDYEKAKRLRRYLQD